MNKKSLNWDKTFKWKRSKFKICKKSMKNIKVFSFQSV